MARPKRSDSGERRTAFLGIWLTPAELESLREIAKGQGVQLSQFSRELLFRRAAAVVASTRRNPEAADLMRELSALGNNLNQISRHLNSTGGLRDWDELRDALTLHKRAVAKVLDL